MMWADKNLIKILKGGGVAVMPTDTIYGIVGQAENVSTVNRIYNFKKRAPEKPCIILISDIAELGKFFITLSEVEENKLKEYWFIPSGVEGPGPVSVILDCPDEAFAYLHRGTKTLAFRLPNVPELQSLLLETGPLIAPSANPEGLPPAKNIEEAEKYFGDTVDLYIGGGTIVGNASKLIKLHKDGSISILRE